MSKPSLLLISAASVVGENRKRLDTLARFFDLTCVTCRPVRSIGFDVTLGEQMQPAGHRLIGLDTLGRPKTTRYILQGMGAALDGLSFDAVLVAPQTGVEGAQFTACDAAPLAALIGRAAQIPRQGRAVCQRVLNWFTNKVVGRSWAEFTLGRLRSEGDPTP